MQVYEVAPLTCTYMYMYIIPQEGFIGEVNSMQKLKVSQ